MLTIKGNLGSIKVQDICIGLDTNAMIKPLSTDNYDQYYAYITQNKIAIVPFMYFIEIYKPDEYTIERWLDKSH